jgi:magnesium-transporting ATPase (P-type)
MSQIQRTKRPRVISLISAWFLLSGGLILIGSILSIPLGQALKNEAMASRDLDASPTVMLLLGELMLIAVIPEILLGAMTIASGFGLRKMQKWGYICSYITIISYTLIHLYLWFIQAFPSPPMAIGIGINILIAIGLIKNKIPT